MTLAPPKLQRNSRGQLALANFMRTGVCPTALPDQEIIVDLFAGGGGASLGIELGCGRDVDVAINHDAAAIAMHRRNHPRTVHYQASVWEVDPVKVMPGRAVGMLWLSPDCTDFSRAKGGQPIRNKRVRSLAWVGVKWAKLRRPRVMLLENVPEFEQWGPLIPVVKNGVPQVDAKTAKPLMTRDPQRLGETFRRFVGQLRRLGYQVEYRTLTACDYGAPTKRKRFFLIARCDGAAIVWPEPTHGPVKEMVLGTRYTAPGQSGESGSEGVVVGIGRTSEKAVHNSAEENDARSTASGLDEGSSSNSGCHQHHRRGFVGPSLKPYRCASECIDWSLPCHSIFLTKEDAKAMKLCVQRPLASNTLRRVAMGLKRFLLDCANPFIVNVNHGGAEFRGQSVGQPLDTITGKHGYGLVSPSLVECANALWSAGVADASSPLPTITSQPKGGAWAVTATELVPLISSAAYSKTTGRGQYVYAPTEPLRTITGVNDKVIVAAHLTKFFGGVVGQTVTQPLPTITGIDHSGLVVANLKPMNERVKNETASHVAETSLSEARTSTDRREGSTTAGRLRCDGTSGRQVGQDKTRQQDQEATSGSRRLVFYPSPLVAPLIVRCAHGDIGRWGNGFHSLQAPLPTMPASKDFALATAHLTKLRGMGGWKPLNTPLDVICAGAATFALTTPHLLHLRGTGTTEPLTTPAPTITSGGNHLALTVPYPPEYYGNGFSHPVNAPLHTITGHDRFCFVSPTLSPIAHPADVGHARDVYALLMQFKDLIGVPKHATLHHPPAGSSAGGYVTVTLAGEAYLIVDIGLRMLTKWELLAAQFGPERAKDYILPESGAEAVDKIGNSVCPDVVKALVEANFTTQRQEEEAA